MVESVCERLIPTLPDASSGLNCEFDAERLPTNRISDAPCRSALITPAPMPQGRRRARGHPELVLDDADGLSPMFPV